MNSEIVILRVASFALHRGGIVARLDYKEILRIALSNRFSSFYFFFKELASRSPLLTLLYFSSSFSL